jgi:hypothetical protein
VIENMATPRFNNNNNNNRHRIGRNGGGGGGGDGVCVLNTQDTDSLLASFPNTRLSYEASIHKNEPLAPGYKCFILPKGKRCVVWVTEWKRNKIVAVIDIANHNAGGGGGGGGGGGVVIRRFYQENGWYPGSVRIYDACMDSSLAYGTVFGGVIFRLTDKTCFSIHTIYWYKGNPIPSLTLSGHVRLCENIFAEREIRQVAYTKQNSVVFGLPVLCDTDQDADSIAQGLPYQVYAIQYRYNTHTRVFQRISQQSDNYESRSKGCVLPMTPAPAHAPAPAVNTIATQIQYFPPMDEMLTNIQATFIVRPNIQNDIYELFVMPATSRARVPVFHNFAHIPSYKTSVMMNRLFRNIAENQRLDALEESEDEAEFENTEPDKYVSLHNEYMMVCRFHKRFCRWVPFQVVSGAGAAGVVTDQQVKQHEFRYLNSRRITSSRN